MEAKSTTQTDSHAPFDISAGELIHALRNRERYYVYRVLGADEELAKLLSVYMDALGNRGPGNGDHFRAWAFALVIDAWGEGEGAWDKRCEALVLALNSSGYEVAITGQYLTRIRHEALKFRNWRNAEHDPEDLRQLGHVARGYLLLRLGLLDSL
ncbi:MAG: hypothetical protein QGD93_12040 [Actinomycetota bacterium]|nr:hypothetical protein [Actinomycetota bacterium]